MQSSHRTLSAKALYLHAKKLASDKQWPIKRPWYVQRAELGNDADLDRDSDPLAFKALIAGPFDSLAEAESHATAVGNKVQEYYDTHPSTTPPKWNALVGSDLDVRMYLAHEFGIEATEEQWERTKKSGEFMSSPAEQLKYLDWRIETGSVENQYLLALQKADQEGDAQKIQHLLMSPQTFDEQQEKFNNELPKKLYLNELQDNSNSSSQHAGEQELLKDFKLTEEDWRLFSAEQQKAVLRKYKSYKKGTETRQAVQSVIDRFKSVSRIKPLDVSHRKAKSQDLYYMKRFSSSSIKSLYLRAKKLYREGNYQLVSLLKRAAKKSDPSIFETDAGVQAALEHIHNHILDKVGSQARKPGDRWKDREEQTNLSPVGQYAVKPGVSDAEVEEAFTKLKEAMLAAIEANTDEDSDPESGLGSSAAHTSRRSPLYASPISPTTRGKMIKDINNATDLPALIKVLEETIARKNQPTYRQQQNKATALAADIAGLLGSFKLSQSHWDQLATGQQAALIRIYRKWKNGNETRTAVQEAIDKFKSWRGLR